MASMIDPKFFKELRRKYLEYDAARRRVIGESAEALARAKQGIFALHRRDRKEGAKLLDEAAAMHKKMAAAFRRIKGLENEGSYRAAVEEYVEARLFEEFLAGRKVGRVDVPGMDEDVYLGGLMDFTGELVRYAIARATERDRKEAARSREVVRDIVAQVIQMNLTGSLRSKYDQAKTNLRKLEEIMYDLSLVAARGRDRAGV